MSNLLLRKIFFISVALLASAVPFEQAQAQVEGPKNFPKGQEIPLPGPQTPDNKVTLWQLPEELKAIIETDDGEFYGIYYSAWSDPLKDSKQKIPGVSAPGWITGANVQNVPSGRSTAVVAWSSGPPTAARPGVRAAV